MTRISVAHRPEISSGADRILWIAKSLVRDLRRAESHSIPNQPPEMPALTSS
jgi:hypothetical protein